MPAYFFPDNGFRFFIYIGDKVDFALERNFFQLAQTAFNEIPGFNGGFFGY